VEGAGFEFGGLEALFRISARRRKTSLALCGARPDGIGDFTLGAVTGGRSVGAVGCGLTTIGFDTAAGLLWLLDRAPMPNMCLTEFVRLSWPRVAWCLELG